MSIVFDSLKDRLGAALASVTGKGKLTEKNISDGLREVRVALLEADVALDVVKEFIDRVKSRALDQEALGQGALGQGALGQEASSALSPDQALIKIVNDELVALMSAPEGSELQLSVQPPAVMLMAGLQGVGKTTTAAKLAQFLKTRQKKSVMLVSTDVHRPAAIDQLRTLAGQAGIDFIESSPDDSPRDIASNALASARKQFADVLIVDTAGRLHLDDDMMAEIKTLHGVLSPVETLFVVDALTGQDAAATARSFGEILPLTGVVLTKADGDSRGGAALSVRAVTGKPIKFMATGETLDALEAFHPDRIASRILGMGDLMSLMEEAEQKIDKQKAQKLARKITRGKKFDLEDFRDQLQQMKSMGGMASMLEKMPGMGKMATAAQEKFSDRSFVQMEAIINSMTPAERQYPDSINGSRKRRIANGSGTVIQDVNRVLKQHRQMQKMMKKAGKKGGMASMMRDMDGMVKPGPSRR